MSDEWAPETKTFVDNKTGIEKTMWHYFWDTYQINLVEKQPLLFVNRKNGGQIWLPVELCHQPLSKDFTKNNKDQKIIQ